MRILFTTFSYYPERSGIPVVVKYLAEGLVNIGHEVAVFTCMNQLHEPQEEIINGVSVKRFDIGLSLTKKPYGDINQYIQSVLNANIDVLIMECLQCHTTDFLLPYLKDVSFKVLIHAHGAPGILMRPFAWEGDILHSIGHFHNWLRWKKYYGKHFSKYAKYIDGSISSCLCASDIDFFSKNIKKNYILENSTDDFFFDSQKYDEDIKKILGIKSSRYIVNIANFSNRKNQLMLLDAFAKSKVHDCALVIIGTVRNEYYDKLLKKTEKIAKRNCIEIKILDKSIERVHFPAILYNASLFVLSSKWEEYSISLVETMATGTPFLSTLAGNARILPGGVTARNDKEFAVLLKVLLDNPIYLKRYGEQGKAYALYYCRSNIIIKNLNLILEDICYVE